MMFLLPGLVPLMRDSEKKINTLVGGKDYDKVTGVLEKHRMGINPHFWHKESDMKKFWRRNDCH